MISGEPHEEDRRGSHRLSEEELEAVAKRAAELVWENFTLQVGHTTIRLFLYVCGAVFLVILGWLGLSGKIQS